MATYSQKSICDKALRIAAMNGGDANASAIIDNLVVLEDDFYSALKAAVIECAKTPNEAGGVKRDHTIAVSGGMGTLPDTVIEECLGDSSVYSDDDDDIGQLSSYQSRYTDYLRPGHSQLAYYAIQGANFLFRDIGGDPNDFDGNIHLVTVSTPDIPATITDPITIATETAERTITILAQMVRGNAQAS